MSYKFDSLIIILNKLDGGEPVTVHSLMNDLEISERTTHRYLKTLQVAGFPINYSRTKESYSFDDGYSLKKPNLSVEETLAFALAKSLLGNLGGGIEKGLAGIEEKLSKKKVSLPKHIALSAESAPIVYQHLSAINDAIDNFQRLEIAYKALYSNELTTRKVDPYYIVYREGFWNLRGYCHLREDLRTFALDRIVSLKTLNQHFLPKKVDMAEELAGSFGSVIDGEPVDVILRFDAEIKPHVLRKKWHLSQEIKELTTGGIDMSFRVNGLEGIKKWIYQWLPHVQVVEPVELRNIARKDLKEALRRTK